eukprot:10785170-Heterocapsa_arctica.AAC.1
MFTSLSQEIGPAAPAGLCGPVRGRSPLRTALLHLHHEVGVTPSTSSSLAGGGRYSRLATPRASVLHYRR